jgi:hypothetical protein
MMEVTLSRACSISVDSGRATKGNWLIFDSVLTFYHIPYFVLLISLFSSVQFSSVSFLNSFLGGTFFGEIVIAFGIKRDG